ncbi:MAG: hypothetical protein HY843_06875, partial [Bdellovibrio sp.]|nr:hypothetical protein [Bdellovibrio sp.]
MKLKNLVIVLCFLFTQISFANIAHVLDEETSLIGTYQDVMNTLLQVQTQYPENTEVFDLGVSNSGEMIKGIKIGHGPINNLIVATHHGNEFGSTEVAVAFAQATAKEPIQGQTIYVIPVLNISGFNKRSRRETANNTTFDPNRDYPGPCGTEGPFNLKSTYALSQFLAEKNIITSATMHTYWPAVVYPWGVSTHDTVTPYDDFFISLVKAATVESHYTIGNSTEVIYPADGTFEDYAFWKHGIWSLLFEIGNSHGPNQADVKELIRVNVPGLRRMFIQSPTTQAEKHEFA